MRLTSRRVSSVLIVIFTMCFTSVSITFAQTCTTSPWPDGDCVGSGCSDYLGNEDGVDEFGTTGTREEDPYWPDDYQWPEETQYDWGDSGDSGNYPDPEPPSYPSYPSYPLYPVDTVPPCTPGCDC